MAGSGGRGEGLHWTQDTDSADNVRQFYNLFTRSSYIYLIAKVYNCVNGDVNADDGSRPDLTGVPFREINTPMLI